MNNHYELRSLTDRELINRTAQLANDERDATIQLLHHLNEIERRKLFLEMGYSSLFAYCTRALRYSSPSACRRIKAARCIREFPAVLALLESGELDLGTVFLVEPVLTEDNCHTVLDRVRGHSYRTVRRVVAEYGAPIVDTHDQFEPVRALVAPSDVDSLLLEREIGRAAPYPQERTPEGWVVSEQKTYVKFLASDDLIEKFEQVKVLLSHRMVDPSFADVLDRLLSEYIARHSPAAKQRRREERKAAGRPPATHHRHAEGGKSSTVGADGKNAGTRRSRHVPDRVRDEVFVRDNGRCTYVAADGTRCETCHGLQIDHVQPYAAGGTHELANLRLLCAAHNRLAAEQALGKHAMAPYWRRR